MRRRTLLAGTAAALATPAIVGAQNLDKAGAGDWPKAPA